MSISDLFDRSASEVLAKNPLYTDYRDRWQYLLESYVGGEAYRDGEHLIKYQLETPSEYNYRLRQAHLDNHCASVIGVYNSFLFRHNPTRDLGSLTEDPAVQNFLRDADRDGTTFNNLMKEAATWSSVFGHAWVVLAKPDIAAITRADEIAADVRPYANILTPLNVLDWSYSRSQTGEYTLDSFKYVEEYTGSVQVIKEWTRSTVTTTWLDMEAESIIDSLEETNGLGSIPAVIVYNRKTSVRGIGAGDLNDIADVQRFIYNMQNEVEQTVRLDSHPSLVTTPDTINGNGAGSIIQIPESLDPGLKPYLLEYSGASTSSILDVIQAAVDSIDKMANIGSIRGTEAKRMSGVAQQQEFELLNARLSEKADNMELAEEQIWRLFGEYQGQPWNGNIEYPDSFNIRDGQADMQQYLTALSANINSPTLQTELKTKIAELFVDDNETIRKIRDEINNSPTGSFSMGQMLEQTDPDDDEDEQYEFKPHIMRDPESGEMVIAKTEQEHLDLSEQGWQHI